jgi:phosphatidylserine/phosphatidylglycerophosphate/cardiolipin synthase-like enzyme
MTPEQLDEILEQTLEDHHLSRGERKALAMILADEQPDAQQLAVFRHEAFAVARDHLHDPRDKEIVGWLEDVIKLLQPPHDSQEVAEARFSPGTDCVHRVISLFEHAQHAADVCVFTITDDRIANAIIEAHQRGLSIRVVTDTMKAFDEGSDIPRLREAGIEVREDHSDHHMHHKFALFDRRLLLTGSFNWTRSATVYNQENIVVTSEPRLVRAFRDTFPELWDRFRL